MNSKIKSMVIGGLLASSLMISVPAMAREGHFDRDDHRWDFDRDHRGDNHWDNRFDDRGWGNLRGSRTDYDALEQARQQALYDASHHASRGEIAQDNAVVDEMLNRMHR